MGRARRLLQRGEAAVPTLLRPLHLAQLLARVQDGSLGFGFGFGLGLALLER